MLYLCKENGKSVCLQYIDMKKNQISSKSC